MDRENNVEIIEAIERCIPYFHQIIKEDLAVALFVDGKCHSVEPAKTFDLGLRVGKDMSNDPGIRQATRTGQPVHSVLPKEVFGIPIEGEVVPVKNAKGEVIAVLVSGYSLDKQAKVEAASTGLSKSMDEVAKTTNTISNEIKELSDLLEKIRNFSLEVLDTTQLVKSSIEDIQSNAARSNMLALNASIEAARAGEAGRGFSVVASEMGKFAKNNSDSAKAINDRIISMFEALDQLNGQVENAYSVSSKQAEEVREMNNELKKVNAGAEALRDLAKA